MTTTTQVAYISVIKVSNYVSGSETVHAADPAKVEHGSTLGTRGRNLVTTRCGIKYADVQRASGSSSDWALFATALYCTRCSRCETLIRKERGLGDSKEPISLLRHFLDTLPADHPERMGVVRAIEVLKYYS
jgi:hypothetical protein